MTWIRILRQLFDVKSSCRIISLKIVLICLSCRHCNFELFSSYSTAVFCFSFFEAVDGILDLIFCKFWTGIVLIRYSFILISARLCSLFLVIFFTFVQACVEFSENVCNSLSRVDGFAFVVFDFGDEDSLFH